MADGAAGMIDSMDGPIEIRQLSSDEICLIGEIDRSEHVSALYTSHEGALTQRVVDIDVPPWSQDDPGDHTVGGLIEHFRPIVEDGACLLGAFDGGDFLGLAIVDGSFEPAMAWLALLHVSRPHRHRGVASTLWLAAERIAADAGAKSMYVSATPSDSAVGFYLSRGCCLADPPHPDLFAEEPEDVHFECTVD